MSNESARWLRKQSERNQKQLELNLAEDGLVSLLMIQALAGTESPLVDFHESRLKHIIEILQEGTIYDATKT